MDPTKLKMIVFGILVVILSSSNLVHVHAAGGGYSDTWSYVIGSDIGPAHWSRNYSYCGGTKQSPINIFTKYSKYHKLLGTLKLKNYDYVGDDVYFLMDNRQTDIEFAAKKTGDGYVPQEVVFQGTSYRFYQFHFHWGSRSSQGSEHLLDWQEYAGEMHMIHYNTKYADVHEAAPKEDGLLVWAHFLKVASENVVANEKFQALLNQFGKAEYCCNKTKITSLSLADLLPSNYGEFYHYKGSLTTPPCYESVKWIVDRNPILVNEAQMAKFRSLKDTAKHGETKVLADHFRPSQGLNGREVRRNFEFETQTQSTASVLNKSNFMLISTVIAALVLSL